MTLFARIQLLYVWLPEVVKAVTVIEAVAAPGMTGLEKRDTVMTYLSGVAAKARLPWGSDALVVIAGLIDTVVSMMNFVGRFTNRPSAATAEAKADVAAQEAVAPSVSVARANVRAAAAGDPELDAFITATSH